MFSASESGSASGIGIALLPSKRKALREPGAPQAATRFSQPLSLLLFSVAPCLSGESSCLRSLQTGESSRLRSLRWRKRGQSRECTDVRSYGMVVI